MRLNLPVTPVEQRFPSGQRLISATDTASLITYCNPEFAAISGYSEAELIGSPHNLVRHPDMPPAVYELMWRYLKAGKSWMGIVKNRCRNGDYYWVNAYVTPILEGGRVVGYESVRVCPTREQVARAEALYARLRNGQAALSAPRRLSLLTLALAQVRGHLSDEQEAEHLKALGAARIVERSSLDAPGKPLQKEVWAAAVDSVGSHTLANVCASLRYGGCVAACGLAQGLDLPASVAPFILRGVSLLGIDSVYAPQARREQAWARLAAELPREVLERNTEEAGLADAVALAPMLLAGQVRGRVVIDTAR